MIQREFQWSMDFDNPKVYGDTSVFDGLVFSTTSHSLTLAQVVQKTFFCIFANYQDHPHGPVLCEEDGGVGFFFAYYPNPRDRLANLEHFI